MHINWKKEICTIPNLLSCCRIFLIPIYLQIYLHASTASDYFLAALIIAVSCLTDAIDGIIARKYNMISNLGKFLDPLADKATQLVLTSCLAARYPQLNPMLALLVAKECFQLTAAVIHLHHGKALPGALMAGKVCTTVMFISLILLVLLPQAPSWFIHAAVLVNGSFLTFSLASYILAYCGKFRQVEDFYPE